MRECDNIDVLNRMSETLLYKTIVRNMARFRNTALYEFWRNAYIGLKKRYGVA